MDIPAQGAPPLNEVITEMLGHLEEKLDALPFEPTVRLLTVRERPVGLANWRGVEIFGSLVPVSLKGGRLEASVRFDAPGDDANGAEAAALALHGTLLSARGDLRKRGFLRLDGADFSLPEKDEAGSSWHKAISYRVLYEYQYQDVDGSRSFITRIPARVDREEADSPDRETALVTGRVVRWQREEADQEIPQPPTLVVRGPTSILGLRVAAFLPDTPAAGVVLLRTFDGAAGAPVTAATLQELATKDHIHKTYASLADFLAELTAPADSVELADLSGDPGSYDLQTFTFGPAPLALPRSIDRLEISTSASGWVGSSAVVYLRAEGA